MTRERAELVAVVLVGAVFVAWPKAWLGFFVAPVALGGLGWVVVTAARDPAALDGWGLRREGLGPTARAAAALLAVGLPACLVAGRLTGGLPLGWTTAASLALYPVWGLVQQLFVLGMGVGPVSRLGFPGAPAVAVVAGAAAFGAVHAGEPALVPLTAAMGLLLGAAFVRWRNLWPLAWVHGWMGALVYPTWIHRDPLREIVDLLLR